MQVRVTINAERCIGCGLCEENLPDVFTVGDYTARVRRDVVDASDELRATATDCPTEAIVLEDVTGVGDGRS